MREEREDPPIQFVQVDGVRLAYRESGDATKPPMVLLHGLALTSAYVWRALISHFKDDYRIIAFDLLGHGDSDKPHHGYEATNQAQLMERAVEALGISSAIIIGHSLGGVVAAHLSIRCPVLVQKLVLYDCPLPETLGENVRVFWKNVPLSVLIPYTLLLMPGVAMALDTLSLPRRALVRSMMIHLRVVYEQKRVTPELVDQGLRNTNFALAEWIRKTILRPNIVPELDRLKGPTLFIVGDTDLLVPIAKARRLTSLVSDGQLTILEHAGHYSLLDRPDEFIAAVDRFLAMV